MTHAVPEAPAANPSPDPSRKREGGSQKLESSYTFETSPPQTP